MAKPYPEHALEEAQAALQRAHTADQLRRAQCVWMRLSLEMNAFQIAKAVGWSVWSVRGVQSQYRRKGTKAFEGSGRGGRRYEVLTRDAENDLLNRLRAEAWPNATLEFRDIHQAVERARSSSAV
jgi:transposase